MTSSLIRQDRRHDLQDELERVVRIELQAREFRAEVESWVGNVGEPRSIPVDLQAPQLRTR